MRWISPGEGRILPRWRQEHRALKWQVSPESRAGRRGRGRVSRPRESDSARSDSGSGPRSCPAAEPGAASRGLCRTQPPPHGPRAPFPCPPLRSRGEAAAPCPPPAPPLHRPPGRARAGDGPAGRRGGEGAVEFMSPPRRGEPGARPGTADWQRGPARSP